MLVSEALTDHSWNWGEAIATLPGPRLSTIFDDEVLLVPERLAAHATVLGIGHVTTLSC